MQENKDIITEKQLKKILELNGYEKLTKEKRDYLYFFFSSENMNWDQVFAIISGAKKKHIWTTHHQIRHNEAIDKILNGYITDADIMLYSRIDQIDKKFKEHYRKLGKPTDKIDRIIKQCIRTARRINNSVNVSLENATTEELDNLYALACIYRSIADHINNVDIVAEGAKWSRQADKLLGEKLQNVKYKLFVDITPEDAVRFDAFLDALVTKTDDISDEEVFTKQEVEDLVTKTFSAIMYVSEEKVNAFRKIIKNYTADLVQRADDQQKEKISKITAKSMILRAGTVLQSSLFALQFNFDFLGSKTIEEIVKKTDGSYLAGAETTAYYSEKRLLEYFPKMQLQGMDDVDASINALNKHVSSINSMIPQKIDYTTFKMLDMLYSAFVTNDTTEEVKTHVKRDKLLELGVDLQKLFTKDNFFEIFDTRISKQMKMVGETDFTLLFKENLKLLGKHLTPSNIYKIIQHNFSLLVQDPALIASEIGKIEVAAGEDKKVLKSLLQEFINKHYALPEDETRTTKRQVRPKTKVKKEEQVEIDDIQKDFINITVIGEPLPSKIYVDPRARRNIEVEVPRDYTTLFNDICYELQEISTYVQGNSDSFKKTGKIASQLIEMSNAKDYELSAKVNFVKVANKLEKAIKELLDKEECTESTREYIVSYLENAKDDLELQTVSLTSELEEFDDIIEEYYKDEKNKSIILKRIREYKESIYRAAKLAQEDKLLSEVLNRRREELEEEITPDIEARKRHKEDKPTIKQMQAEAIARKYELDSVEYLITIINECLGICKEPFNRELSIQEEINEIEEELIELDKKIELKKKNLKAKYSEVYKYVEEENVDLSENPYGKRMLDQLEDLKKQREVLQRRLDELKAKLLHQ